MHFLKQGRDSPVFVVVGVSQVCTDIHISLMETTDITVTLLYNKKTKNFPDLQQKQRNYLSRYTTNLKFGPI